MMDFDTKARIARLEEEASKPPDVREIGKGLFPWLVFFAAFGGIATVMRVLFGG